MQMCYHPHKRCYFYLGHERHDEIIDFFAVPITRP